MNTIIPNELSFSSDLDDLPARVTQVSSEEFILSGGRLVCDKIYLAWNNGRGAAVTIDEISIGRASDYCRQSCPNLGSKYLGSGGEFNTATRFLGIYMCNCCRIVN